MTAITIELPDDIAQSAQQAGLLSSQNLASVLRELVRQMAAKKLQKAIQAFEGQPVNPHELEAGDIRLAIHAARRH